MNISGSARRRILHLVISLSLIAVFPTRTFGWSEKAHRIIAALAWSKLRDEYKAKIKKDFLDDQTKNASDPLVVIAAWADERGLEVPAERKWHFVNIPLSAESYDQSRDCADLACIVVKVNQKKIELGSYRKQTRLDALKYLVHLIGDLHQPLHCTDNNDSAGIRISVKFFGNPTNLHKVWDADMIQKTGLSESQYVEKLKSLKVNRGDWFEAWANESHSVARKFVYDIPKDRELGNAYYKTNLPILELQLVRAAERLAHVLESTLQSPVQNPRRAR
jgi:hypothetical protein